MVISLRVNFDLRIFLHFLLVCYKKNFNLQNIFHQNLNCSLEKDIALSKLKFPPLRNGKTDYSTSGPELRGMR